MGRVEKKTAEAVNGMERSSRRDRKLSLKVRGILSGSFVGQPRVPLLSLATDPSSPVDVGNQPKRRKLQHHPPSQPETPPASMHLIPHDETTSSVSGSFSCPASPPSSPSLPPQPSTTTSTAIQSLQELRQDSVLSEELILSTHRRMLSKGVLNGAPGRGEAEGDAAEEEEADTCQLRTSVLPQMREASLFHALCAVAALDEGQPPAQVNSWLLESGGESGDSGSKGDVQRDLPYAAMSNGEAEERVTRRERVSGREVQGCGSSRAVGGAAHGAVPGGESDERPVSTLVNSPNSMQGRERKSGVGGFKDGGKPSDLREGKLSDSLGLCSEEELPGLKRESDVGRVGGDMGGGRSGSCSGKDTGRLKGMSRAVLKTREKGEEGKVKVGEVEQALERYGCQGKVGAVRWVLGLACLHPVVRLEGDVARGENCGEESNRRGWVVDGAGPKARSSLDMIGVESEAVCGGKGICNRVGSSHAGDAKTKEGKLREVKRNVGEEVAAGVEERRWAMCEEEDMGGKGEGKDCGGGLRDEMNVERGMMAGEDVGPAMGTGGRHAKKVWESCWWLGEKKRRRQRVHGGRMEEDGGEGVDASGVRIEFGRGKRTCQGLGM